MPSACTTTLPWAAPVASDQTLVPSGEAVSLAARLPLDCEFSPTVAVSATAAGTGATSSVTVVVDVEPSTSVIVYVNESGPL